MERRLIAINVEGANYVGTMQKDVELDDKSFRENASLFFHLFYIAIWINQAAYSEKILPRAPMK